MELLNHKKAVLNLKKKSMIFQASPNLSQMNFPKDNDCNYTCHEATNPQ